jgi:uncharacterized protein
MPPTTTEQRIAAKIAEEIGCRPQQVQATAALLDEGATVPFIARYRKEVTGGLDDIQLRLLDERLVYLRELEERRRAVLASIDEQGKLTPGLSAEINAAETKQSLEDLYLPYKPKRRTKAQIAREAGLAPLADALLADPTLKPEAKPRSFINADAGFADVKACSTARARSSWSSSPKTPRCSANCASIWKNTACKSTVVEGKETEGAKFRDYFDYSEAIRRSRRTARWRSSAAATRDCCNSALVLDSELMKPTRPAASHPCEARIAKHFGIADRAARPTSGSPTRCAGPGASRSRCTSNST